MAEKSTAEEEYFHREEAAKTARLAAELAAEKAKAERAERKALHFMRCGKCGGELKTTAFRGVDIDICQDCGVVLLDPGELETLAGKDESGAVGALAKLFSFGRK